MENEIIPLAELLDFGDCDDMKYITRLTVYFEKQNEWLSLEDMYRFWKSLNSEEKNYYRNEAMKMEV